MLERDGDRVYLFESGAAAAHAVLERRDLWSAWLEHGWRLQLPDAREPNPADLRGSLGDEYVETCGLSRSRRRHERRPLDHPDGRPGRDGHRPARPVPRVAARGAHERRREPRGAPRHRRHLAALSYPSAARGDRRSGRLRDHLRPRHRRSQVDGSREGRCRDRPGVSGSLRTGSPWHHQIRKRHPPRPRLHDLRRNCLLAVLDDDDRGGSRWHARSSSWAASRYSTSL